MPILCYSRAAIFYSLLLLQLDERALPRHIIADDYYVEVTDASMAVTCAYHAYFISHAGQRKSMQYQRPDIILHCNAFSARQFHLSRTTPLYMLPVGKIICRGMMIILAARIFLIIICISFESFCHANRQVFYFMAIFAITITIFFIMLSRRRIF